MSSPFHPGDVVKFGTPGSRGTEYTVDSATPGELILHSPGGRRARVAGPGEIEKLVLITPSAATRSELDRIEAERTTRVKAEVVRNEIRLLQETVEDAQKWIAANVDRPDAGQSSRYVRLCAAAQMLRELTRVAEKVAGNDAAIVAATQRHLVDYLTTTNPSTGSSDLAVIAHHRIIAADYGNLLRALSVWYA